MYRPPGGRPPRAAQTTKLHFPETPLLASACVVKAVEKPVKAFKAFKGFQRFLKGCLKRPLRGLSRPLKGLQNTLKSLKVFRRPFKGLSWSSEGLLKAIYGL